MEWFQTRLRPGKALRIDFGETEAWLLARTAVAR